MSDLQSSSSATYMDRLSSFLPVKPSEALGSFVGMVSSALPTSAATPIVDYAKQLGVVWKSTQRVLLDGQCFLFIVLGTKTGFHLYQLHQSRGLRHVCANHDGPIAALHVLSPHIKIGDNPSSIALSAAVISAEDSPRFPRNCVNIIELVHGRCIHTLRFPQPVHALHGSPNSTSEGASLVVSCRARLFVLCARTLKRRWTTACAPQPDFHSAIAVGARWIAYPSVMSPKSAELGGTARPESSNQLGGAAAINNSDKVGSHTSSTLPVDVTTSHDQELPARSETTKGTQESIDAGVAKFASDLHEMASNATSDLFVLGETGKHRVASLIGNSAVLNVPSPVSLQSVLDVLSQDEFDSDHGAPTKFELEAAAGSVIIRDLISQRVISHFKAHKSAIAALTFDPAGGLLLTVPKNGQHFYLWQLSHLTQAMIMQQSPTAPHSRLHLDSPMLAPRKLLKLFRGYSPALVRSASFSSNSRWLAVTSDRGTTHIYSISNDANTIGAMPEGTSTPVDDPTVARATNVQEVAISHHQQQIHAVPTVMAVHRIRQSDVLADDAASRNASTGSQFGLAAAWFSPVVATFHRCSASGIESVLTVSPSSVQLHALRLQTSVTSSPSLRPSIGGASTAISSALNSVSTSASNISQSVLSTLVGSRRRSSSSSSTTQNLAVPPAAAAPPVRPAISTLSNESGGNAASANSSPVLGPATGVSQLSMESDIQQSWTVDAWLKLPQQSVLLTRADLPAEAVAPVRHASPMLNGMPDVGSNQKSEFITVPIDSAKWLAAAELVTSQAETVPLWASPQFVFRAYSTQQPDQRMPVSPSTLQNSIEPHHDSGRLPAELVSELCIERWQSHELQFERRPPAAPKSSDSAHQRSTVSIAAAASSGLHEVGAHSPSMESLAPSLGDLNLNIRENYI